MGEDDWTFATQRATAAAKFSPLHFGSLLYLVPQRREGVPKLAAAGFLAYSYLACQRRANTDREDRGDLTEAVREVLKVTVPMIESNTLCKEIFMPSALRIKVKPAKKKCTAHIKEKYQH